MLSYLRQRKFLLPGEVCKKFNLKFSPQGRWAGRLLIPLNVGWTGRAVRSWIEPRYLAETDTGGFFIHGSGLSAVLVEGPIDAMKLAVASSQFMYLAMAGSRLSPALIRLIRERNIQRLYLVPDSTAPLNQAIALRQELRASCTLTRIIPAQLPINPNTGIPFKDSGEMEETDAQAWLYSLPIDI
jgi:hypothetical protein